MQPRSRSLLASSEPRSVVSILSPTTTRGVAVNGGKPTAALIARRGFPSGGKKVVSSYLPEGSNRPLQLSRSLRGKLERAPDRAFVSSPGGSSSSSRSAAIHPPSHSRKKRIARSETLLLAGSLCPFYLDHDGTPSRTNPYFACRFRNASVKGVSFRGVSFWSFLRAKRKLSR